MNLKNSVLHRKGAEIAKVRKENQSATRTAPIFHLDPQGEWSSTIKRLFPLRSLRLLAFAVRFSGSKKTFGKAASIWLAPLFHHGPRWLNAEQNARASLSPAFIRFLARVYGRVLCDHRMQRSLRLSQPSRSSSARLVSASLKHAAQPRSTGFSSSVVRPRSWPH